MVIFCNDDYESGWGERERERANPGGMDREKVLLSQ